MPAFPATVQLSQVLIVPSGCIDNHTHIQAAGTTAFSLLPLSREQNRQIESYGKALVSIQSLLYRQGAVTVGFQQAREMSVSFDLSDVFARMSEVQGDSQIISGGAIARFLIQSNHF